MKKKYPRAVMHCHVLKFFRNKKVISKYASFYLIPAQLVFNQSGQRAYPKNISAGCSYSKYLLMEDELFKRWRVGPEYSISIWLESEGTGRRISEKVLELCAVLIVFSKYKNATHIYSQ